MGQRHQYIVILPKLFYNKGNVNNKPKRAFVVHHQWLYGYSAISTLDRVLRFAAHMIKDGETDYTFGRDTAQGDSAAYAIESLMSTDVETGYFHKVHIYEDDGKIEYYSPSKLHPDMFDNNDGITVIEFEKNKAKPKVCFITPNHLEGPHWSEEDGRGPWTPNRYLQFYYSTTDRQEWSKEDREKVAETIIRINSNSRVMSESYVNKLLPKFELKLTKQAADQLIDGYTLETE
jgi:hypothetical protein